MITSLQEYLNSLTQDGAEWVKDFTDYIDSKYNLPITMFRQCPMYKKKSSYLDGYLMFTAGKNHFTLHTLDFDLLEQVVPQLPKADFGKGCIKVKYKFAEYNSVLKEFCDKVIARF